MKFAIRDDDTNFFTKPEDLEKIYSGIWNICPVSLSVVPFVYSMKSPMIPEKYWYADKNFPIAKNYELVSYLKEKIKEKKVSIMLHGYSHKDNPDGYEFASSGCHSDPDAVPLWMSGEESMYEKIKRGKEYLEDVFGVGVNIFVPPHNTISKEGIKAVIKNGMNLAVAPSFYFNKRPWNFQTLRVSLKRKIFKKINGEEPPYVLDFGDHKEIRCYPLTPPVSFEVLKEKFDFAYKHNGIFCLATHYWEFDAMMEREHGKKQKEIFDKFWRDVCLKEQKFSTVNELISWS